MDACKKYMHSICIFLLICSKRELLTQQVIAKTYLRVWWEIYFCSKFHKLSSTERILKIG